MGIEICGLGKTFITRRSRTEAIKNIGFTIEEGEFVCLLGPSGCGKTTLLNIIAGLEKPTEGMVLMDGIPVIKPGPDRAVLFQNAALFPWLTVIENVEFGLRIKGIGRLDRKRTAEKYLQIVGMERYAKAYIHELSGGMKQRVDLARALALGSRMLIMDEPFAALDQHSRCEMQDELLRIWKETGKTILFVTHSVDEAIYLADRIIIMTGSPGKIRKIQNVNTERPRRRDDLQFINQLADIMQDIKGGMTDVADVAYTVNATIGNGIIQDIK